MKSVQITALLAVYKDFSFPNIIGIDTAVQELLDRKYIRTMNSLDKVVGPTGYIMTSAGNDALIRLIDAF